MTLHIQRLVAENYKRLKAVEITPEGNVVTVAGRNAQGKTSVLDAIWAALAGGEAGRATSQPIREGQDSAVVKLDLGEYKITRRWTKDDSGTLTVESADGAKYSSPQKLLDEVVGARAFDPLAFTRQSVKDQVATLVSTVELPFDPDELERQRKGVYDRRTEVGREVTKLEGQLKGYPLPDESLPAEEVSASQMTAEYQSALDHNSRIERGEQRIESIQNGINTLERQIESWTEQIATARMQQDALELDKQSVTDAHLEPIDTEALADKLASADMVNQRIRQEQNRRAVDAELQDRKNDAAALTIELRNIEKRKADALGSVTFPVDGLSFDESGVTYKGIPFGQASAAEQLRVSVALAMAANPKLRVLRILDGSLLDADSFKVIEELAAEHEYQVWVEVVDSTGTVGITIEDGQVQS